jgi:hypothetical protein
MTSIEHFAHYLTTVSGERLNELLTIEVRGARRGANPMVAAMFTSGLRAMVHDEILLRKLESQKAA